MADLSFLDDKEDDSSEIRATKSYWKMVMGMPISERRAFLQERTVEQEERWLQQMVRSIEDDDKFIAVATAKAKQLIHDYQTYGSEDWLHEAELWAEIAKSTKELKYGIKDIRKQRERIQWQRSKLTKMMQQSEEPSQSSNHSKT